MSINTNTQTKTIGFKKKNSNINIDANNNNTKGVDKLGDLKSKLQKQKQMMKKTGRRFREDNSISTQQGSILTENNINGSVANSNTNNHKNSNSNNNKHDISIGSQQPIKQTISLKQIGLANGNANENGNRNAKQQSIRSSQVFQKQFKQQKKRSKQVHQFLKNIQLQMFSDALIQNGFDDLQTLSQVTSQELNLIMMRAQQQDRLMEAIKGLKVKLGIQQTKLQKSQPGTTSTLWRTKTQRMQTESGPQTQRVRSSQIVSRLKTQQNKQQHNAFKPGSFLMTVGSRNWSTEDQIRRACSVCFKVQQQMEKKGDCFYCSKCYKFVSEDLLQISLGDYMSRSYKKLEKE